MRVHFNRKNNVRKDDWNCSRGWEDNSLCVGNCHGASAIKRCSCHHGECAWKTRGPELNCSKKVGTAKSLSGSPIDRELMDRLKLTDKIEKVPLMTEPSEALLITSSDKTLSKNLGDIQVSSFHQ